MATTVVSARSARRRRSSSQSGKYEPGPQLRDRHSMVPARVSHSRGPVAVAGVHPLRAARPVRGAADRVRLGAHQRLDERLQHRAQQIRLGTLELLGHGTGQGQYWASAVIADDLLQIDFRRSSEGSRGGRLLRPHDTLAVEDVVHHATVRALMTFDALPSRRADVSIWAWSVRSGSEAGGARPREERR